MRLNKNLRRIVFLSFTPPGQLYMDLNLLRDSEGLQPNGCGALYRSVTDTSLSLENGRGFFHMRLPCSPRISTLTVLSSLVYLRTQCRIAEVAE